MEQFKPHSKWIDKSKFISNIHNNNLKLRNEKEKIKYNAVQQHKNVNKIYSGLRKNQASDSIRFLYDSENEDGFFLPNVLIDSR